MEKLSACAIFRINLQLLFKVKVKKKHLPKDGITTRVNV